MNSESATVREIVSDMEMDIRDMKILADIFYKYTSPAELEEDDHAALSYFTGKLMSAADRTEEAYDRLFEAAVKAEDGRGRRNPI